MMVKEACLYSLPTLYYGEVYCTITIIMHSVKNGILFYHGILSIYFCKNYAESDGKRYALFPNREYSK